MLEPGGQGGKLRDLRDKDSPGLAGAGLYYGWVIVAVLFLTLFVNVGVKNTYGVFLGPILAEYGWSRASLSLSASTYLIVYGICQPMVGWLIDRWGPKWVVTVGLISLGVGITGLSQAGNLWHFHLFYGILGGFGAGATSASQMLVIVSRWFEERRGRAMGVTILGMAGGQMAFPPLTMYLILRLGWRPSFLVLGVAVLVVVPLAIALVRERPKDHSQQPLDDKKLVTPGSPSDVAVSQAMHSRPFKQLCISNFVCGFTVNLVAVHFVLYALGKGFAPMHTGVALGLMGVTSMLGSFLAGLLSDRFSRKNLLGLVFFLRGLGIVLILISMSVPALYLAVLLFGLARVATLPLITGLTQHFFGRTHLGTLSGWINLIHQIGAALGAFGGGLLFDRQGSYLQVFIYALLLCLGGALNSWLIKEKTAVVAAAVLETPSSPVTP